MSISTLKIELELPSSIYFADPYAAVRSIIGNDVEIVSISKCDIILPDNNVLIKVEFNVIDFNSFIIYKVLEIKTLNNMSSKNVITRVYDPITKTEISEIIVTISKIDVGDYITICCSGNVNFSSTSDSETKGKSNIKYYALKVNSNPLHSYCSILDTSFFSYHGTTIQHTSDFNSEISETLKQIPTKELLSQIEKLVNSYTSNNYSKPKNLNLPLPTSITSVNLKDLISISEMNEIGSAFMIDLNKCKYTDLLKLEGIKGIILVSKFRLNANTFIFIPDTINVITKEILENLMIVLDYDSFNSKLLKK